MGGTGVAVADTGEGCAVAGDSVGGISVAVGVGVGVAGSTFSGVGDGESKGVTGTIPGVRVGVGVGAVVFLQAASMDKSDKISSTASNIVTRQSTFWEWHFMSILLRSFKVR